MDRSDAIHLIKAVRIKDDMGVFRQTVQTRRVFAQVDSITRAEFFDAGRMGFKPSLKFTIFCGDYDGESAIQYNGRAYAVYRTYLARNDNLELYAEEKGGIDGGASQP